MFEYQETRESVRNTSITNNNVAAPSDGASMSSKDVSTLVILNSGTTHHMDAEVAELPALPNLSVSSDRHTIPGSKKIDLFSEDY